MLQPDRHALKDDGVDVMHEPVKECRGQGAVVVEDLRPKLEGSVRGDNRGAPFIALRDDLEEEVGALFGYREIAKLIN